MASHKKSHTALESALEKVDFSDSFGSHPFVHWISENGQKVLLALIILFLLLFLGYRVLGTAGSGTAQDYLLAEKEMQKFVNSQRENAGDKPADGGVDKLALLLKKYPELQPKYDGRIAQMLLIQNDIKAARPFLERSLQRFSKLNLPLYYEYSTITPLIAEKQYAEAREYSQKLQAKIEKSSREQKAGETGLYAMNVLRLAELSSALGDNAGALEHWGQLREFLSKGVPSFALEQALKALTEENLTILDYIAHKEKELQSILIN